MQRVTTASLVLLLAAGPAASGEPPADALRAAQRSMAELARDAYAHALDAARTLDSAIDAFADDPTDARLGAARTAWVVARDAYNPTEVFRFSGGPIDDVHPIPGVEGPEGRLNAWPVDEAYLDRVPGSATGGIIGEVDVPLTAETLVGRNALEDETQVTLGYHAIEFLLWGQDTSLDGPGDRPASDFTPGDPVRDRRRACLSLLADLLVDDLAHVAREWTPGTDHFRDVYLGLRPADAYGRALSGAATLSGFELGSERLGVPLYSGDQEDEHSCFSDTTDRDILGNVAGLTLVLRGDGTNPGLLATIAAGDEALARDVDERLTRIEGMAADIAPPIDRILIAPADDPGRLHLEALSGELVSLAGLLREAGGRAGVAVLIGG